MLISGSNVDGYPCRSRGVNVQHAAVHPVNVGRPKILLFLGNGDYRLTICNYSQLCDRMFW